MQGHPSVTIPFMRTGKVHTRTAAKVTVDSAWNSELTRPGFRAISLAYDVPSGPFPEIPDSVHFFEGFGLNAMDTTSSGGSGPYAFLFHLLGHRLSPSLVPAHGNECKQLIQLNEPYGRFLKTPLRA
jgi:hypothetical protein